MESMCGEKKGREGEGGGGEKKRGGGRRGKAERIRVNVRVSVSPTEGQNGAGQCVVQSSVVQVQW